MLVSSDKTTPDQDTPLDQHLNQPKEEQKKLKQSFPQHASVLGPFRHTTSKIIEQVRVDNNPSSALQTTAENDALVAYQELYEGNATRMNRYQGTLANGPISPLRTEKGKQPSVATILNRQSLQSTEFMRTVDKRANVDMLGARSLNSSMVSEAEQVSSSCKRQGMSPMKMLTGLSGEYTAKAKLKSPIRGKNIREQSNSDLYNQRYDVEISKKRLHNETGRNTDQSFMPQPIQTTKDAHKNRLTSDQMKVIKERMASTQITLASAHASQMLDPASQNSVPVLDDRNNHQQPQVRKSLDFDRNRFNTRLSQITTGSIRQSLRNIPSRSTQTHKRSGERPKILTFDHRSNERDEIQEQYSTITAQRQSQLSPVAQKKQKQKLTDSNCRYKELTWVQKGIGRSSNVNFSAEFKKYTTTTLRGTCTRTSRMSESMRGRTLEPIGEGKPCKLIATQRVSVYAKKPNPYYRRAQIEQQMMDEQVQFEDRSLEMIMSKDLAPGEVLAKHQLPVQDIVTPKFVNKLALGQSAEQIIDKNDSVFSGMRTLKFQEKDSQENSLFERTKQTCVQSIKDTHASSKDNNLSHRLKTQENTIAKLQSSSFGGGSVMTETEQSSQMRNWRQSSHDTHVKEMRPKRSYETFEIAVGGKTGASIFFDGHHAEKMENGEFDRLFGARRGRKFRIGQSIEMNQGCRTMVDQLNYLHPKLRDMLQKQYVKQTNKIDFENNKPRVGSKTTTNWQPSRVHYQNTDQSKQRFDPNNLISDSLTMDQVVLPQTQQFKGTTTQSVVSQLPSSAVNPAILIEQREVMTSSMASVSKDQHEQSDLLQLNILQTPQNRSQAGGSPRDETFVDEQQASLIVITQNEFDDSKLTKLNLQCEESAQKRLEEESAAKLVQQENKAAFAQFKKLGGSFFRQSERQVIAMDNDGALHYQPKSEFVNTIDKCIASPTSINPSQVHRKQKLRMPQTHDEAIVQRWDQYKDDVLRVVKKGILSNEPKPKKIMKPPTPEPELHHLFHLEVKTVRQLIDSFDDHEREEFQKELLYFQSQEDPTRFLIERIDELKKYSDDPYSLHLSQVYKMLFKKRVDMAHSRERLRKFKPEKMEKHIESFMRKIYNEYVAEVRAQLVAKRIEKLKENGMSEAEAMDAAIKAMSVTKIEETKVSYQHRAEAEKDCRIVDYIKYLIGETVNNDFELKREEFKQTHELHTKSLALSFDEYAAKEDNSLKKVANDILERVEFNIVISEHTMPIAALKYADDPKFKYFMKIREQMSLALPLLSKVVNKQLSLHNYNLGYEHCVAFGETCRFNYHFMSKLVLNNNGLTDESLAALLDGLQHMHTLSKIDLRRNHIGRQSVQLMQDFMMRRQPKHLQVLRIVDCKMDHSTTGLLLDLLCGKSDDEEGETASQKALRPPVKLRTLALVNASFNDRNEKKLVEYLGTADAALREVDLSWNYMSQHAYIEILKVIVANNNLLMLNLSRNQLIIDPKTFTTDEGKLNKQERMARFKERADVDRKRNETIRQNTLLSIKKIQGSPRGSSHASNLQRASSPNSRTDNAPIVIIGAQLTPDRNSQSQLCSSKGAESGNFLQVKKVDSSSLKSYHSEGKKKSSLQYNEIQAKRILKAENYVSSSSKLNQLVTLLLTKVLKENRRLQHLDLTSTNLPSQVIIHLCNRLRKSRSICSVHFTDNPGLEEVTLEQTIQKLMRGKPRGEPRVKVDVNSQIDFALDSNMLQRLQRQLSDEKTLEGDDDLIAANTIRFRQIMQQKRIEQKAAEFPQDITEKKMILSRIIGMKEQMPGSGQWQLLTDRQDECWHCDQWIYSLVFWDAETIGRKAKKTTHSKVLNQMIKKVEQLNPELDRHCSEISLDLYNGTSGNVTSNTSLDANKLSLISQTPTPPFQRPGRIGFFHSRKSNDVKGKELEQDKKPKSEDLKGEVPMIFGDFTNWKGQQMMRLDDFILLLAKKYGRQNQDMHEDFEVILNEMKKNLSSAVRRNSKYMSQTSNSSRERDQMTVTAPSPNVRRYEDLSEVQQRYYNDILEHRQKKMLHNWKSVIEQYLEYRKPYLVDAYLLKSKKYKGHCPNLFVLPVFMPAGKHTYMVKNMDTYEYTLHNTLADFRTEDPPILLKELRRKNVQRVFRKDKSVFEPWHEDNELTLLKACESDLGAAHIDKIVKDSTEKTQVYDLIFDKFAELKLLFLQYTSESNFPNISLTTMDRFAEDFKLMDDHFKLADMHIIFAGTKQVPAKGQHKMGLNRCEFIEVIVRIAIAKYMKTKEVETATEAIQKLINENLFNEWHINPAWQDFRNRYLWTLDVNDVLAANTFGLQKLYNRHQTIHKTWLEYQEAIQIFSHETSLLPEVQLRICYAFSKMTIQDDATSQSQHCHLQFVEFLELIGRVSVAYWECNKEHLEEVPLAKKIEFVIDQLFALVGMKRNEVVSNLESESETDDEY